MKTKFILLIAFLAIGSGAFAQRHLKGIKGVDILGGITGKGYYGELGFNSYISNKLYYNLPIRAEFAEIQGTKFNSYSFNPNINYTLLKPTEWFFISAKGGASIYMDSRGSTNSDTSTTYINDKTTTINYGVFAGIETEVYFSDKVVWIVNFRQNYNFNSTPGHSVWYAGTGVRLNIF